MSFYPILIKERPWLFLFLHSQGLLLQLILAFLLFRWHYALAHNFLYSFSYKVLPWNKFGKQNSNFLTPLVSVKLLILQAFKKLTRFFKSLGVKAIFDTSCSRDLTLVESCVEFTTRYKQSQLVDDERSKSSLPMIASACPGMEIKLILVSENRVCEAYILGCQTRLDPCIMTWRYLTI